MLRNRTSRHPERFSKTLIHTINPLDSRNWLWKPHLATRKVLLPLPRRKQQFPQKPSQLLNLKFCEIKVEVSQRCFKDVYVVHTFVLLLHFAEECSEMDAVFLYLGNRPYIISTKCLHNISSCDDEMLFYKKRTNIALF